MGLDVDNDGQVDYLDIVWWLGNTRCGGFFRLNELHKELKKWRLSASDARPPKEGTKARLKCKLVEPSATIPL